MLKVLSYSKTTEKYFWNILNRLSLSPFFFPTKSTSTCYVQQKKKKKKRRNLMHVVKGCCLWVNDADDDGDKNTIIAT